MAKTAGILIIGNEVLSGKVVDQNSPYLVRELRALGVEVRRITTLPDEVPVIAQEVKAFAEQYDLVFTTGGIGPTHDDVTIAAISAAFERSVVRHPLLEDLLRRHYGDGITAAQLRMAEMPEGSEMLEVGDRAFPVVVFRNVHIFPGIPEAVRRKFERIRERFREQPFLLRRVFLRCDEGQIAGDLNDVMSRFPKRK
jgi:molybdenum cofactor synthesis domain-containing protein